MVHQLNKVKILFSQEVLLNCPNGAGEEVKKVKSANLDRDGWTQCMKADLQNKYNYLQLSQTKKKTEKDTWTRKETYRQIFNYCTCIHHKLQLKLNC